MSTATVRLLSLAAALTALTGACTPEFEGEDDGEPTLRNCETCNTNSPAINEFQFPELHLGGLPNSAGVRLVGLINPKDNVTYKLTVDGHEDLAAVDAQNKIVARGAALVGWVLMLEKDAVRVTGMIAAHDATIASWAQPGRPMTAYAIAFSDKNMTKNVCPTYFDTPWTPVLTIIRGETYDREHKLVDLVDSQWVTFACADEAAYKAKRLGYEQNIPFGATNQPATIAQQDATLKMITADYCGTGKSFTQQGTKLFWENTAHTVTLPNPVSNLEAVWTEDGALCLDTPRYVDRAKVQAECDIPKCGNIDLAQVPHEWVTWVP